MPCLSHRSLLTVLLIAVGLAGCGPDDPATPVTRHENVRAAFLGTASDGRDVVVHHEAIPGLMDAMVMALPLADTTSVRSLAKGDKIRFDLVIRGSTPRIEGIEVLPDTVTLRLDDATRDTTSTDSISAASVSTSASTPD